MMSISRGTFCDLCFSTFAFYSKLTLSNHRIRLARKFIFVFVDIDIDFEHQQFEEISHVISRL